MNCGGASRLIFQRGTGSAIACDIILSPQTFKTRTDASDYGFENVRRFLPLDFFKKMKKPFKGTTEKEIIEHGRAMAVRALTGMSSGRIRRKLQKIYDHLPGDQIKMITKIYLKHHK